MTSASVISIANSCNSNLTKLSICSDVGDKEFVQIVKKCPNLTELEAESCTDLTDKSVSTLANNCPKLDYLYLSSTDITDKSITAIAHKCNKLSIMALARCSITDASLIELSKHCALKGEVYFIDCPFLTDGGICAMISACALLTIVTLDHCSLLTDISVECIANKCIHLESISMISCSRVTDTALSQLIEKCTSLQEFSFAGTQITDCIYTQAASGCDFLHLNGTDEPSAETYNVKKIHKRSGRTGVEINMSAFPLQLANFSHSINDLNSTLDQLDWCKNLSEVCFDGYKDAVNDILVCALIDTCPLLHTLVFLNCSVGVYGFNYITVHCTCLKSFKISHVTDICDSNAVSFLEKFGSQLVKFTLGDCQDWISDETLRAVATHCADTLVEFDCGGSVVVTDEAVIAVLLSCTRLTRLNISKCALLTENVLFAISQHCEPLKHLNISGCPEIKAEEVVEFLMFHTLSELCFSDEIHVSNR
eukprot:gene24092-30395_t